MKMQILTLLFICVIPRISFADDFEIKRDEDFNNAVLKTQVVCRYTNHPDQANHFNSFFVGHIKTKNGFKEKLISVGHGFKCGHFSGETGRIIAVSILLNDKIFDGGSVLKAEDINGPTDSLDIGLFEINLPFTLEHKHLRIGRREWVSVGSRVVVRGFMYPSSSLWDVTRYKVGYVEYVGDSMIRISTSAYPGMSGSPVALKYNGKWYVIGVVSQLRFSEHYGLLDMLWASLIPKDFIK
ncbi:MAG: trypsin-like peptidase domain-containing protein [Patescibacteria group bacterium]